MVQFTITGDVDPFLHVSLRRGEEIVCESGAMVMMEDTLDLQGRMGGGVGRALLRRFAGGESFFLQHIGAVRGDGDCLLSPALPGALQCLEVGACQYLLSDGAFVAATAGVTLEPKLQGLGNALFAQTGGFVVLGTQGSGQVVVSGLGSLFLLDVAPGRDVTIDNAHVVAWDARLHYEVSVPSAGGGLLGNLVNSVTSGEALVLRFGGSGQVLVCSRNRASLAALLKSAGA